MTKKSKILKRVLVDKYIEAVSAFLIERYGKINAEWTALIQLLADNLELYNRCKESVDEVGIFDVQNYRKNPLLSTMKDLNASILKQVQQLGLSPYSITKISNLAEADEDSELLRKLTANDDDDDE